MSYRNARHIALAVLLALLGHAALQACGPFFPRWLVTDPARLLDAPVTWLSDALQIVPSPAQAKLAAVVPENGPHRQTAEVDLKELGETGTSAPVVAQYRQVREQIASYGDAVAAWREEAVWADPAPPRPAPPAGLQVPAGLPGEIEDYLRGAVAYYRGDLAAARAAWTKLLDRPLPQRRLRSTWAAYMLGRAFQEDSPETAIRWFEKTRELAGQGLSDPLGLAVASLGWQARAESALKRPEKALVLYLEQVRANDPRAEESIRRTCNRLLEKDPEALKRIAASDEARPIMNAYLLSRWDRVDYEGPLDPEPARKWLTALATVPAAKVADADRLAWIAYRGGDFDGAQAWLKRASAGPMTDWIQAKLYLRAGKLADAERLLARAAGQLPPRIDEDYDSWSAYENMVDPAVAPRAQGDRGAALLGQKRYGEALKALAEGGFWTDAAYVAERVMTTDELKKMVDATWPAEVAAEPAGEEGWELIEAGLVPPPQRVLAHDLRYLLGRRLAREGRYEEAKAYLQQGTEETAEHLARFLAEGHDPKRPAGERSKSLFRAACLTRHQGLELIGTELEPDWFLYEGQYENNSFSQVRADGEFPQALKPTADERQRVEKSAAQPLKRFHYRYRGIALAQEAADLVTDDPERRAEILATAGNWVEGRDPDAARPLLVALLSCCAKTDVAVRAKRLNAIPNIPDACDADLQPAPEGGP